MLDLTNGLDLTNQIHEGFQRGNRHTRDFKMWLIDRQAPTPEEKAIVENLPFVQGEYDFSTILGGRVYNNRPLTYQFEILNRDYQSRKIVQTALENWLMRDGFERLYDDHAEGYYYIAKCTGVNTADSYGGLTVDIEFNAYPFKISELAEGNDIWDTFNFELDVSQITEFTVNDSITIALYNVGASNLTPAIKASAPMTIIKDGITYNIGVGETKSYEFSLLQGENKLTIQGNGTIEFLFYKELI